jgi:hypothetical protein
MRNTLLALLLCLAPPALAQDSDDETGGLDDMEESHLPNPAPIDEPPVPETLSQKHPGDIFEGEAEVVYTEQWNRPEAQEPPPPTPTGAPIDWYKRTNYHKFGSPYKWKFKTGGVPFPPDWTQEDWMPPGDNAFVGGSYEVLMWDKTYGTATPNWQPVGELEHLFYRYYVWFDTNIPFAAKCDGGKLPGLTGYTGVAGNSGNGRTVRGGHAGWSLRGGYGVNCPGEAGHPLVSINTYAYHGKMLGDYGDHWRWGQVETGRWYCLEGEVIVNTPGIDDGVLRGWIDGELKLQKSDLLLRAPPYDQAIVDKGLSMGIYRYWGTLHHGGKYGMWYGKPEMRSAIRIDQVVVANQRIGCYVPIPPPVPPEVAECEACLDACAQGAACTATPTAIFNQLLEDTKREQR